VICQFQCNVRTHAHRNKRQYLPLIVGNRFVKISKLSTFSRLSLCACAYCCNTRIFFICEYYTVVTVTQTVARLAQLGGPASIVEKSGSWTRGFETQPDRSFLLHNKFYFLYQIIFKLYLWTVSMNMWFDKQIVMTQFRKMFKIRFPAVINISICKTTIKKSSHILSISFCRWKQFNISIQQYSCIAFYRLNKFQFLTTHYISIQLSTLIQRWINVDR